MPSRKALIVGVSQYDESTSLHPLDAPFGDANAVYQVLKQYGNFDLPPILLRREDNRKGWVSTEELEKALDTLFTKEDAEEVELAVFYFSGHGSYDSKSQTSYLAASDNAQAVSLRHLLDRVENSHFKNVCIWLDSCHSGGALEFKELKSKNYCVVAAASKFGYALIGKTGHSFLTELLCQALTPCQESAPTVTTFELVRYLKVQRRTLPPLQHVLFLHGERHFPLTFCDHALPDNGQISRDVCPFKGLEAFTQNDANFFYGRKRITQQFLDRLEKAESKRLIPIVGASGSGKSSLVLAGILPNLLADDWEVQVIQPAGGCPLHNLQVQIPTDKKYLLVIDQFEQVFTQCHDEADRTAFKHLLAMALQPDNRLYVLLILRLDFLDRFTKFAQDAHPEMGEYLRRIEFLSSLNADELHQAITEPLTQVGMSIENSLVNELSTESLDEKGSLPLLQYTLEKLWLEAKQTGNDRLTWDLYRQLGGQQGEGLRGILNQKADAFYHSLNAEQQHLLEWLMVELTQPSEGQEDTRRTVPLDELHHRQPQYKDALDALLVQLVTQERLLTQDADNERQATVTVAHEALIRDWQRLRDWLESNREIKSWRMRLEDSITAWKNNVSGSLLREKRLIEAQQILSKYPHSLLIGQNERAFIIASQIEAKRRKQLWMGSLVIFIVVLLVGIAATTWQWREAERQKNIALLGKLTSQSALAIRSPSLSNGYVVQGMLLAIQSFRYYNIESVLLDGLSLSGMWKKVIYAHENRVSSVLFSPDGKYVASSSWDGTLKLWDSDTTKIIGKPFHGHESYVNSISFSPNGKYIISGGNDRTLRLWNIKTGQSVGVWRGHTGMVFAVAFSSDNKYVVSGGLDGIKLWNVSTGMEIKKSWNCFQCSVDTIAFSPDNKHIITGGAHTGLGKSVLILWDVETGQIVGEPWQGHNGLIKSVSFSPNGKSLISGSWDGTLRLWNVETKKEVGSPWYASEVNSVVFSPDGKLVASATWDGIKLWDAETGRILATWYGHESIVTTIAFSPDGKSIVSGSQDNTIRLWEILGNKLNKKIGERKFSITALAFSSDNKTIISGDANGYFTLWDVVTGGIKNNKWAGFPRITSIALSPDGKQIVSSNNEKILRLWNLSENKLVGTPWKGHEGIVFSVDFSPNGKYVVSGSDDKTLMLWDVKKGIAVSQPWTGHVGSINAVKFSHDGKYVISGSSDGTIRLWSVETGSVVGEPWVDNAENDVILSLAFSPDGEYVISGHFNGDLKLWDVKLGEVVGKTWHGHSSLVNTVAFSPDGKYIASGSSDKTLKLWDFDTRKLIGGSLSTYGEIKALSFSPNGKYIISGGEDKILYLWDADPESWAKKACSIVNRNFSLAEWQRFIGDALPYQKTCPDLPAPGEEGWVEPYVGG